MSHDVAMDILPVFMIVAVAASIALGFFLGKETDRLTAWAVFRARRAARRARAAATRAEGERALAIAQRDDLRAQLERAESVISETTHAVHRAGTLPDLVDADGTTALMDAVTDGTGRALGGPAPATVTVAAVEEWLAARRAGSVEDLLDDLRLRSATGQPIGAGHACDEACHPTEGCEGLRPSGRHHAQSEPCPEEAWDPERPGAVLECDHPGGAGHAGDHRAAIAGVAWAATDRAPGGAE
ncbi:hypothetical protein [Nocardiopsis protaetiae]|uniref:hypothetical protein n=1 Tax=Nocardiopsis protaetiae TaxID=3382270 RepID=UPI00387B017B